MAQLQKLVHSAIRKMKPLSDLTILSSKQLSSFSCCRKISSSGLHNTNSNTHTAPATALLSQLIKLNSKNSPGVPLRCQRFSHSKSQGETQFLEFLEQEITSEKEESKGLPTISGFDVSTNGPDVKLTKSIGSEHVTVEFNITDSVSSESDMEDSMLDEDNPALPSMMSLPDFTVTLSKKGSSQKLAMRCSFRLEIDQQLPEDEKDRFDIMELAMLDGDWTEKMYSVNGDLLDANMYDMLMLMMEERGINHQLFSEELQAFSTQHEHDQYVSLLQSLKDFVKA